MGRWKAMVDMADCVAISDIIAYLNREGAGIQRTGNTTGHNTLDLGDRVHGNDGLWDRMPTRIAHWSKQDLRDILGEHSQRNRA